MSTNRLQSKRNDIRALLAVQLEAAAEGQPRKQAQRDVDEASTRAAKFSKQLEVMRAGSLPKIEVGSLEEVMSKMMNDTQVRGPEHCGKFCSGWELCSGV